MNRIEKIIFISCFAIALALYGCASSEESAEQKDMPPPVSTQKSPEQSSKQDETATQSKVDTVNVVNVQTSPKPTYESTPSPLQSVNVGNFAVQVGAFKMQEGADRAAALARERFGKDVITVPDNVTNMLKVLVGNFSSKDDARKFRDDILQKFPAEYKGAWVTEISQK